MWKRLAVLPQKVEELEARVAELEAKHGKPLSKTACPGCGEQAFFVSKSTPTKGQLGYMGLLDRTYTCKSCGFSETIKEKG